MKRPLGVLCGLALVAFLGGPLSAQAVVVPTDIQMPGTQPGELVEEILVSSSCNGCHGAYDLAVEPLHLWGGSMMANATRDPVFWAAVAVAEQDVDGAGDFCLRCHTPGGWLAGRSVPTDGSALTTDDADGVTCDFCHRLTDPDLSEYLGEQNSPFEAHDENLPNPTAYHGAAQYVVSPTWFPRLGPYDNAATPHPFDREAFIRSPDHCGTCHDVSNPFTGDLAPNNGAHTPLAPGTFSGTAGTAVGGKAAFNNFPYDYGIVERTYSEHAASALDTMAVADYVTLPADLQDGSLKTAYDAATAVTASGNYENGDTRNFSCQTCHLPAVNDLGCSLFGVPVRPDMPKHDLTGANFFVPQLIDWLDTTGPGLVAGGGLTTFQLNSLAAGEQRARDTLADAATMSVYGNTLTIVNHTGHKLPTGYPEGRRMWVRVTWEDAMGGVLEVDGGTENITATLDAVPTLIPDVLDVDGNTTRIYEVKHGISQDWADKLINTLGVSGSIPLMYDRETGATIETLGGLAASAPGTVHESFHFVLNNTVISDNRIPPYGMDYDIAVDRNAQPVPDTQFGNPGTGGTYTYKDTLTLDPPLGATYASIELLYEPVSWEYAYFLKLANDGSLSFLSDTGDDLVDAWRNGVPSTYAVAATADWFGPWEDLGEGVAGTYGEPELVGTGPLTPGTPMSIILSNALENQFAVLFVGFSALNATGFYGGTLVPDFNPPGLMVLVNTGPTGSLTLGTTFGTVPSGFEIYLHYWLEDVAGPFGLAASNALRGTVP